MGAGGMGLSADDAAVPHGNVSLVVANDVSVDHEMVILPLASSQDIGTDPVACDARIDEAGSLGEASRTGGGGAG
jgi:hypothetical protein